MSEKTYPAHAAISDLMVQIRTADMELDKALKSLAAFEMKAGQECAYVVIGGVDIALTAHDRSYMPRPVQGRQRLREEVIRVQKDRVLILQGKVEGLRWKLQQQARSA